MGARQADHAHKYQQSGTKRKDPPMLADPKDQRSWTMWCTLSGSRSTGASPGRAPLMVFTDWRQFLATTDAIKATGWMWHGVVTWDKRSGRPMLGRIRQEYEYVVFGTKGRFDAPVGACLPRVYDHPVNAARNVHLTSLPVGLVTDLLRVTLEDADVLYLWDRPSPAWRWILSLSGQRVMQVLERIRQQGGLPRPLWIDKGQKFTDRALK